MKKRYIKYFIIVILLTFLDQLTKYIVVNSFNVGEMKILINNFLKFYYIRNTGASFGIFSNQNIFLIVLTLLLVIYIIYDTFKSKKSNIRFISTALILSGAFGNLIDRVLRKYVVDFISFTLFNHEMAIFNVADIYITFGVLLYIYIIFMEGKYERNSSK